MHIIHGTWIPQPIEEYLQEGAFYLWVETDKTVGRTKKREHSRSLAKDRLAQFLSDEIGVKQVDSFKKIDAGISAKYFILPSAHNQPLKSYELMQFTGDDPPETFEFKAWEVSCYQVQALAVFNLLKNIYFLFSNSRSNTLLGSDLAFWYHYTQSFKEIILKDRYIPSLRYQKLPCPKDKRRKNYDKFRIHPTWEIISDKYEAKIKAYASWMPQICVSGTQKPMGQNIFFDRSSLLQHFSENMLLAIIQNTQITKKYEKQIEGTFLSDCMPDSISSMQDYSKSAKSNGDSYWKTENALEVYKNWRQWSEKLREHYTSTVFAFCFKLKAAESEKDNWKIYFQLQAKNDPSLKIDLADYWHMDKTAKTRVKKVFGKDLEKKILLHLGQAAKIYPKIWEGLETDKPTGICLNLEEAFDFLKESSWILQESDFKVIVPAWWTPEGRRKAKIRLKTSSENLKKATAAGKNYFGLESILKYSYELSIGGEVVSEKEWNDLVNAKSQLVKFRGQWIELDQKKMNQMLEFWQNNANEKPEINVLELIKLSADEDKFEFDHDDVLKEMMAKLCDKSKFEVIPNPDKLNGKLREYQKKGVSWLSYLESLKLNGCLADDMGLGKTIQVIALLIYEREKKEAVLLPTLIIVPTSVIGNWNREINKFAPHLSRLIHHGSNRCKIVKEFKEKVQKYNTVITSYALARRDAKLFQSCEWERIVLDEAQNIKNPKAAQTKAILKIKSKYRLALTGTPVENRLMDLWSIFNFLNSGYLETQAKFRKAFELPIQKENNAFKTKILKNLVEPFILRRMKTDKNIIKDLPDKVEQKVYCTLSKEQASLYESVVKDILEQIEETDGIQRKGLILSSLTKLKQICNHPSQFLQDNSEFTKQRSHKLSRLTEMIEEAIESGESLLIFTQFKESAIELEQFIKNELNYNTYLIHGSISRKKREQMIQKFQDPETEPSVFILSLKAGGVGITLTKANHVFHFDRWWNPAVEDQATDRAFRIGQKKNVFVHKFVSMGTLEERIDQMIEEKKKISGAIMGSGESWLTELDNESFKELIALNKEAVWE